jgi:hypothetical protein
MITPMHMLFLNSALSKKIWGKIQTRVTSLSLPVDNFQFAVAVPHETIQSLGSTTLTSGQWFAFEIPSICIQLSFGYRSESRGQRHVIWSSAQVGRQTRSHITNKIRNKWAVFWKLNEIRYWAEERFLSQILGVSQITCPSNITDGICLQEESESSWAHVSNRTSPYMSHLRPAEENPRGQRRFLRSTIPVRFISYVYIIHDIDMWDETNDNDTPERPLLMPRFSSAGRKWHLHTFCPEYECFWALFGRRRTVMFLGKSITLTCYNVFSHLLFLRVPIRIALWENQEKSKKSCKQQRLRRSEKSIGRV